MRDQGWQRESMSLYEGREKWKMEKMRKDYERKG